MTSRCSTNPRARVIRENMKCPGKTKERRSRRIHHRQQPTPNHATHAHIPASEAAAASGERTRSESGDVVEEATVSGRKQKEKDIS